MMVDLTVQIVLSTLQTAGLLVGIFYYIMTLRNAQANQKSAKQWSELQVLMTAGVTASEEGAKRIIELLNMKWDDYDDFERKYGSDNNPDNYAKRNVVWNYWSNVGLILKRGLIDKDLLFEAVGNTPLTFWVKFGDVIKEIRRRYNEPLFAVNFEYLAHECVKYMQEKGFDTTVPDTFYSYVPDKLPNR